MHSPFVFFLSLFRSLLSCHSQPHYSLPKLDHPLLGLSRTTRARERARKETEKSSSHLGRDPLLRGEHDAVAREHAQRRAGVADGLHGVLDLVEPPLGAEDGRAGVVAPGHGCGGECFGEKKRERDALSLAQEGKKKRRKWERKGEREF